jgi:hypothetical protein
VAILSSVSEDEEWKLMVLGTFYYSRRTFQEVLFSRLGRQEFCVTQDVIYFETM